MIKRKTIEFKNEPLSLNWRGNDLIDWVGGGCMFSLNGDFKRSTRNYAYRFDSAIQSDNGIYAILYEKLGTKALLLKNGEILRELNRSFYQAHAYEYPIAFVKFSNDKYAIVHCPNEYNQIEMEWVESGEKITNTENRKPDDCFHSRFRLNPSNTVLLNSGWVWHPYGIIELYNIRKGIEDNSIFDIIKADFPTNAEICSAEFLSDDLIVVSSTSEEPLDDEEMNDTINLNPGQIGLYSIEKQKFIKKVSVDYKLGTLIPIDENHIIDLYEYPKIIDLNTGIVTQKFEDINSGKQDLAIIHHIDKIPPMAFDSEHKRLAIANGKKIRLLEIN